MRKIKRTKWQTGMKVSSLWAERVASIDRFAEKLRQVVLSKHGNPKTTTDIVCKHFIDAVENQKYGWFWTCPNGGDQCKYKHSLPPGYVLSMVLQLKSPLIYVL